MSGRRKICVKGHDWEYRIGKKSCVMKSLETGRGCRVSIAELLCIPEDEVERGLWKRTLHVTPRDVEVWLWDEKP